MEKITTKTIEEENPHFVLEMIAELVAEKTVGFALSNELSQWEELTKAQREKLDAKYKHEIKVLTTYLCERAETHYQYNAQFNKNVKGKSNRGRDYLYTFMYHWSGGHDDGSGTIVFKEAGNYKKSMANWKRDVEKYNNDMN